MTDSYSAPDDDLFMALALEEAKRAERMGEVPIGAVVVHQPFDRATRTYASEPVVIARAHNEREGRKDPSAHAEFSALLQASHRLDAWRLTDCTVYVTLEPCIMCAGLMHQARVRRCVYGAPDPKAGALGSLYEVNADTRLNHVFEVTPHVREEECALLLKGFFKRRRGNGGK